MLLAKGQLYHVNLGIKHLQSVLYSCIIHIIIIIIVVSLIAL